MGKQTWVMASEVKTCKGQNRLRNKQRSNAQPVSKCKTRLYKEQSLIKYTGGDYAEQPVESPGTVTGG